MQTALLFAWFFLAICSYAILRPVRGALVLADFGPQVLPWVYMGTAVLTGAAVWLYNRFTHLPRRTLFGGFLLFFAANLVAWWAVARTGAAWASPAFYVWTDIFSIMNVTVFWTYANDVVPSASARRVFGVVSAAGTAGGILGSGLTRLLVGRVGAVDMLLVSAAAYGLVFFVFSALEARAPERPAVRVPSLEHAAGRDLSTFSGVLGALRGSRVLGLLTVLVCFERMVPDFVDYAFAAVMHERFPTRDEYAAFFAAFELWRSLAACAGAALLTGPILTRLGAHAALVSVPAVIAVLGLAFAAGPAPALAVLLKGLEEGQRHSWFKAAKELLYTATDPAVIYRVKSYVEMFFYRMARGVAGLILLGLTAGLGLGPAGVVLAAVPLALVWMRVAWSLGRAFEESQRALEVGGRAPRSGQVARGTPA